ncbi:hypothetical protein Agabi119p4_2740 [Agaricus bisporus var. burnettii]|uniref:Mitochondrial outer membrane protein IML2 n=1 Tax=Agaricus bisporus var. burnettii TaxID=192524 RepID=A0A8H7F638_AGABI|nr:hypothetical protein Agabi119p4_2740 [Agaricus bisporus var. burnettii]
MDLDRELATLSDASNAFGRLFEDDMDGGRALFDGKDDPFHLIGLGTAAFLEAALGLEAHVIEEANRALGLAEAGTRKFTKQTQVAGNHRFQPGIEWEIINAHAVILLGLVHALSESYVGYLQCLYALNSAHSKFTKLFKSVFPNGLDPYLSPSSAISDAASHGSTTTSLTGSSSSSVSNSSFSSPASSVTTLPRSTSSEPKKRGFLIGRFTSTSSPALTEVHPPDPSKPDNPIDDLIIAGTAFGYGLFNLAFSLLPKRVQSVVGLFGFKADRKLGLNALTVSAARNDTHSVFAGLVLMTYYGVVLLLSGFHANESDTLKEYQSLVDRVYDRYPNGALWILNKAKLLRMSNDPEAAINVLEKGLKPERQIRYDQGDSLLVFELAWTLLGQRRYEEAAKSFLRITELNTWSHATYYFVAAGCYWSIGNYEESQRLFDAIPGLLEKKIGGKDLPTEVFIKKKIAFYQSKQKRLGKKEANFVEAITFNPAEELGAFWNNYARISDTIAHLHINEWYSTLPPHKISSPHSSPSENPSPSKSKDLAVLDTPDEFALRSLLLGIIHRTIKDYSTSRAYLLDAHSYQNQITNSTWIGSVSMFELAVLDLKEVEAVEMQGNEMGQALRDKWQSAIKSAGQHVDKAMALVTNSTDLSSRLDMRVSILRDEIGSKKAALGIV